MTPRPKYLRRLRSSRREPLLVPFSEDLRVLTGISESSGGSHAGSDDREAWEALGSDVWLAFGDLERADVRIDSQGLLAISRRAMLGEDGEL
jgi:hypothetical protein